MNKIVRIVIVAFAALYLSGCAGTIPVTSYTPQNFIRYNGSTDIGKFEYAPASTGKVAPNQIQNTDIRNIYLGVNVVDFVQRATTLELEKTGFIIGDKHPLQLSGVKMGVGLDY